MILGLYFMSSEPLVTYNSVVTESTGKCMQELPRLETNIHTHTH